MLLGYSIPLLWCFHQTVLAQDDEFPGKIDCFSFSGASFSNNTQCPGSRICCQTADYCDSNRFCRQNNQIVIPTCAIFPWDDSCARICKYGKCLIYPSWKGVGRCGRVEYCTDSRCFQQTDPGTGFLPRAVECSDGSFCCDNDPACCAESRGIVLNGLGAVVSTHSGTATTSSTPTASSPDSSLATTTTSSTAPTDSTTNTAPNSSGTSSPNDSGVEKSTSSSGLSSGAKAGIGIGVTAVVLIIAVLSVLLMRSRRRNALSRQGGIGAVPPTDSNQHLQYSSMYSDRTSGPSELGGISTNRPKEAHKIHELPDQRNSMI